jgi:hypothetical protein
MPLQIPHTDSRRQAIGTTLAAAPPLRELRDKAQSMLESGKTREEVRKYLGDVAVNHNGMGLRAFLGINRKAARAPISQVLVAMAAHWAKKLRAQSVGDALSDFAHEHGLDQWLADYILDWIDNGEAPAIAARQISGVGTLEYGPSDDKVQVVYAGMNSLGDPEKVARDFLDECARTFPKETWMRKGFAERDAERLRLFHDGKTDFDIAKAELEAEGWQYVAATAREYNAEVKTRANSVLRSRNRWLEYVTNIVEPVSRKSD